jgi:hypothetical protein
MIYVVAIGCIGALSIVSITAMLKNRRVFRAAAKVGGISFFVEAKDGDFNDNPLGTGVPKP